MGRALKRRRYTSLFAGSLALYLSVLPVELAAIRFSRSDVTGIDRQVIAEALTPFAERNEFPATFDLQVGERAYQAQALYTLDEELQSTLTDVYRRYKPDYASFVALDPTSGAVLAMVNYVKDGSNQGNLALRATFPAASVFKVITAAAALDQDKLNPRSITPYNGKRSSLYKRQVLRHKTTRWTRRPTLTKAFAQSVNTVFARVGVFSLGAGSLNSYADRFGFNRVLEADLPLELGITRIEDDQWSVAESASGYTRSNTLSPVHGAMIAAAVVNEGDMRKPFVVDMLTDPHGVPLYIATEESVTRSIDEDTAAELRVLMRETIKSGSARGAFRHFFRSDKKDIEVGGKTGSLTGTDPRGRTDWFIGYAQRGDRKLAFASVTVNIERWTVKSAYVARRVIERFYRPPS